MILIGPHLITFWSTELASTVQPRRPNPPLETAIILILNNGLTLLNQSQVYPMELL